MKVLASQALKSLGPKLLATLEDDGPTLLVEGFLEGGHVSQDDLTPEVLADVGPGVGRTTPAYLSAEKSRFEPVPSSKLSQGGVSPPMYGCAHTP